MITVTDQAADELRGVLDANDAEPGQAGKLIPNEKGGIGYTISIPSSGDEVMRRGEEPILILDPRVASEVDGLVLDVQTDEKAGIPERRFTLRLP